MNPAPYSTGQRQFRLFKPKEEKWENIQLQVKPALTPALSSGERGK